MSSVFRNLAALIVRRPVVVLLASIAVTLVFAAFSTQAVNEQDVAADESQLTRALETIDESFGERQSVLQVVIRSDTGDVRSADALRATTAITQAIETSGIADTLIDAGRQPAITSFLAGAEQAARTAGLEPADLTDAQVRALQAQALEGLPDQVAGQIEALLGDGDPPPRGCCWCSRTPPDWTTRTSPGNNVRSSRSSTTSRSLTACRSMGSVSACC